MNGEGERRVAPLWMSVYDAATGEQLLGQVRNCRSFLCRLRGLTFRRSLADDEGLLLVGHKESRLGSAIHMFFVFFPIAVIWLDREDRVVDARRARSFAPIYVPQARAQTVLEGPPRLLDRIGVGDKLRFEG